MSHLHSCETEVWVCRCIPDDSFQQNSDGLLAKLVGDADIGYFRSNDYGRARSLAQRGDLRRLGTMPFRTCPCQFTIPQWAECKQDKVPCAGEQRPTLSVFPIYTDPQVRVRRCMSGNMCLRNSDVLLAKLVVDVDIGYFLRDDFQGAWSIARRRNLR